MERYQALRAVIAQSSQHQATSIGRSVLPVKYDTVSVATDEPAASMSWNRSRDPANDRSSDIPRHHYHPYASSSRQPRESLQHQPQYQASQAYQPAPYINPAYDHRYDRPTPHRFSRAEDYHYEREYQPPPRSYQYQYQPAPHWRPPQPSTRSAHPYSERPRSLSPPQQRSRSWDEYYRQQGYPYSYPPQMSRREPRELPEPARTQPGHDLFFDAGAREPSSSRAYSPSYGAQRPYSSRAYPGEGEDRRQHPRAAPPAANRRVSELGGFYIPPHQRGQSVPVSTPHRAPRQSSSTTPSTPNARAYDTSYGDSSFETSFDTPSTRPSRRQEFAVTLPTPEYIALSDPTIPPPPHHAQGGATKLLVLDLNGALVFRPKMAGDRRRSHPRPYLACFLEYLFLPEPIFEAYTGKHGGGRPWEVFVWSSAQPDNVRAMVEASFGEVFVEGIWADEEAEEKRRREERGEGRLMGVWARDKMGLSAADYRQKVQTVKDLRILSAHLDQTLPDSKSAHLKSLQFDESNMVLLDDSPLKAIHQPWNEIILPEYDKAAYQASKTAAVKDEQDETVPEGMDDALVCVVGILEEMRGVENVPAWIRAGGLTPTLDPIGKPTASSAGSLPLPIPALDNLPSYETFQHWHAIPSVRQYWLQKGKSALSRKGIELRHGVDPSAASSAGGNSPRYSPARSTPGEQTREMIAINDAFSASSISGSPARRKGGYSPSRPNDASMSPSPPPRSLGSPLRTPRDAASPPSRSHPAVSEAPTAPARGTKLQPADRFRPVDTWRTFKASDVALFLLDMSDRSSVPLTNEQRVVLRTASSVLGIFTPECEDEDVSMEGHAAGVAQSGKAECLECVMRDGEMEAEKRRVEMIRVGKENGMVRNEPPRGPKKWMEKLPKVPVKPNGKGKEKEVLESGNAPSRPAIKPFLPPPQPQRTMVPINLNITPKPSNPPSGPTKKQIKKQIKKQNKLWSSAITILPTILPRHNLQPPVAPKAMIAAYHTAAIPSSSSAQSNNRTKQMMRTDAARGRLVAYPIFHRHYTVALRNHLTSPSRDTLKALRSARLNLQEIRRTMSNGKKTPEVIAAMAEWEEIPGEEDWARVIEHGAQADLVRHIAPPGPSQAAEMGDTAGEGEQAGTEGMEVDDGGGDADSTPSAAQGLEQEREVDRTAKALGQLAEYNALRPKLEAKVAIHAALGTKLSLNQARQTYEKLGRLRRQLKGGEKCPEVIAFLANTEILPELATLFLAVSPVADPALPPVLRFTRSMASTPAGAGPAPGMMSIPDIAVPALWRLGPQSLASMTPDDVWIYEQRKKREMKEDGVLVALDTLNELLPGGKIGRKVSARLCEEARRLVDMEGATRGPGDGKEVVKPASLDAAASRDEQAELPLYTTTETTGVAECSESASADIPFQDPLQALDKWRERAFMDLVIPNKALGDMTLLVLKQIYQDIKYNTTLSRPLQLGKAPLSSEYPQLYAEIRDGAIIRHEASKPQLRDPKTSVVFELAIMEATRLVRLRKEAIEGVPVAADAVVEQPRERSGHADRLARFKENRAVVEKAARVENGDAESMEDDDESMEEVEIPVWRTEGWESVGMPPVVGRAHDEESEGDGAGRRAGGSENSEGRAFVPSYWSEPGTVATPAKLNPTASLTTISKYDSVIPLAISVQAASGGPAAGGSAREDSLPYPKSPMTIMRDLEPDLRTSLALAAHTASMLATPLAPIAIPMSYSPSSDAKAKLSASSKRRASSATSSSYAPGAVGNGGGGSSQGGGGKEKGSRKKQKKGKGKGKA